MRQFMQKLVHGFWYLTLFVLFASSLAMVGAF